MLLSGFLAVSCAVTPEEDTNYSSDRVMKAWLNIHYPGVRTFEDTGAYVLEMEPGNGPAIGDSAYVWTHYVKRSLNQTITSTNIQQLAEQLGTYSATTYYGSDIWQVDKGYLPDGLEAVLKTMRGGGHVKIALPISASNHSSAIYSVFTGTSESENQIIDLTVDTVVNDIYDYQERTMRTWFQEHYASTDTISEGLYFKKLIKKEAETDTIPEGNSVSVRYIGRLLDGTVFDTNIEDTAKFYRIWKSGGSYTGLTINFYKTDDTKRKSENSVVDGFAGAVMHMNYGETAVTVFNSKLGYQEKGSRPSIPGYSPLCFWLYTEPKN